MKDQPRMPSYSPTYARACELADQFTSQAIWRYWSEWHPEIAWMAQAILPVSEWVPSYWILWQDAEGVHGSPEPEDYFRPEDLEAGVSPSAVTRFKLDYQLPRHLVDEIESRLQAAYCALPVLQERAADALENNPPEWTGERWSVRVPGIPGILLDDPYGIVLADDD